MSQLVTGLFTSYAQARSAVIDLKTADIDDDDISLIANNVDKAYGLAEDVGDDVGAGAGIGAAVGGVGGLLAGLGLMAIPGIGPVVAAGWFTSTVAGAVAGAAVGGATGGIVGAMTDNGISKEDAEIYAEHIRRGGALVCVDAADDEAEMVRDIIARHQVADTDTLRGTYKEEGWEGFRADQQPLTAEQIRAERNRYGSNL